MRNFVPVRISRMLDGDFVRHGAVVFGGTAVVSLMNYGFHWYVSRRLSVPEYGEIAALIAVLSVLSVPATIATTFVVKLSAELHAVDDLPRVGALARRAFTVAALIAIVVFGGVFTARDAIAAYLRIADSGLIVLLGAGLAAGLVLPSSRGILQGLQRFDGYAASLVCEGFVKLTIGLGLVALGRGVAGAVTGLASASFAALLLTESFVRRLTPAPAPRILIDRRRALQSIGAVAVGTTAIGVLSYVDLILAKHFLSPFDAGTYVAVGLAGKVFLFVGTFLPAVVLPKAAMRAARGHRATGVLARAAAITGLMFSVGLCIYVVAPRFVLHVLVGSSYDRGVPYVLAYACAMAALAFTNLLVTYRISTHDFRFVVPLLGVTIGEVAGIYVWHGSIAAIVRSLVIGNVIAMGATAFGTIPEPSKSPLTQPIPEVP